MPGWNPFEVFKDKKVLRNIYTDTQVENPNNLYFPNAFHKPNTQYGLKLVVDQHSKKENIVDIIAIHGLNGHYAKTWTAKTDLGTDINWLQDLLPTHIHNARIMSYSYNSTLQFSKSLAGIETFAEQLLQDILSWRQHHAETKRPIVFICHSLGGLVFRQVRPRSST
jgi:hypothetical protein